MQTIHIASRGSLNQVIGRCLEMHADNPERALSLEGMNLSLNDKGVERAVCSLSQMSVLKQAEAGQYYLDEAGYKRFIQWQYNALGTAIAVGTIVVMAILL